MCACVHACMRVCVSVCLCVGVTFQQVLCVVVFHLSGKIPLNTADGSVGLLGNLTSLLH